MVLRNKWFPVVLLVAFAATALGERARAEWGDLKLVLKLSKDVPKKPVAPIGAVGGCAAGPGFAPAAVGPKLEVPNVLVWLSADDPAKVPVHPDVAAKLTEQPRLDNKGCLFVPHCLIATAGQTLLLTNSDPFGHNSKLDFAVNTPENPIIPAMGSVKKPVPKIEKRPTPVSCGIHPHMTGFVMVAPTPYHAVSGADGVVHIKNVPVGKWEFKFWHEVHGNIAKVERAGKPEAWAKGVTAINIVAGENDFGEIKIVPKE